MIKVGYHKKRFFLMGMVAFCIVLVVVIVSVLISTGSFDDRSRAVSGVGVELKPASGEIGQDGLSIDLVVNTGDQEITGVKLTLEYSEEIDYVSFTQGNISNCTVSDLRQGKSKVNMHCNIDSSKPAYKGSNGVFATVKFRPVGKGEAKIEVLNPTFTIKGEDVKVAGSTGEYIAESKVAIELEPESGVITEKTFDIELLLDTHGEAVDGIDVTLEYLGDIEYVSFSQGEVEGCEVLEKNPEEGIINYFCFMGTESASYSGEDDVFITAKFRAKYQGEDDVYEGEGSIEVTRVDFAVRDSRNEITFAGSKGEYTTKYTLPPEPTPPQCGTRAKTYDYETEGWQAESTFCRIGSALPSGSEFPAEGQTASWECLSDDLTVSCSAKRNVKPPPPAPVCGSRAQRFSFDVQAWPANSEFCRVGVAAPEESAFPEMGTQVEWLCVNVEKSVPCSAIRDAQVQVKEPLPDASIFDNTKILLGFTLVLISAILLAYKKRDSTENFSMRNKLCL